MNKPANNDRISIFEFLKWSISNNLIDNWNNWRDKNSTIDIDFSGINFDKAILDDINFENINFMKATFRYTSLKNSNFCCSNMMGADMTGSNMKNANLNKTIFRGSTLIKVNFTDANANGANMMGTNIMGSNMKNLNLYKTNLVGAIIDKSSILTSINYKDAFGIDISYTNKEDIDNNDIKNMLKTSSSNNTIELIKNSISKQISDS